MRKRNFPTWHQIPLSLQNGPRFSQFYNTLPWSMLPFDGITCLMSQQVSGLFSLIVSWLSRWHVTKDLLTPLWQCHSVNIQFHPQWTIKCRKAFQSSTSQPNNGLKSHMLRIAYLKLYYFEFWKKYYQRRIYMYIHINRIIRPSYYNLAPSISIFNLKDRKAVRSLNLIWTQKVEEWFTFFI